jgi:hypothetical protein
MSPRPASRCEPLQVPGHTGISGSAFRSICLCHTVRDNFRRQRLALDDDERQAQRTAADHSEEAGRALRDRLADLGQELRKTQRRAAADRARIDADLPIAHRSLDEARWQRLMAERALSAYQQISLWSFLAGAMRRNSARNPPT